MKYPKSYTKYGTFEYAKRSTKIQRLRKKSNTWRRRCGGGGRGRRGARAAGCGAWDVKIPGAGLAPNKPAGEAEGESLMGPGEREGRSEGGNSSEYNSNQESPLFFDAR